MKEPQNQTDKQWVESISLFLKDERNRQKLSQESLSALSGVDRVTISRTENGRAASILTIIQLLRGLNRTDVLFGFVAHKQQASAGKEPPSKHLVALKPQIPADNVYPDW